MIRLLTWGLITMIAGWWLYTIRPEEWLFVRLGDVLHTLATWLIDMTAVLPMAERALA